MMMLSEYLAKVQARLPSNPNVLDIGCGNSAKWNYLGVVLYLASQGLGPPKYVCIDLKGEAFAVAKEALGGLATFIAADARYLTDYLKETYHLVLFEHPNLSTSPDGPKIWQGIFEETAKVLDNKGAIILTSFWVNDHIPAQVALERAGFHILYSGRNKYPGRQFDISSKGESLVYDKYILVARLSTSQGSESRAKG
jgi:SAM-dependent methyltransferase